MSNIVNFSFESSSIRAITDESGETWFVGRDVCETLGYVDATNAMKQHCKGVVKRHPLETAGGMQDLRVLSEPDVLRLIIGSRLPAAERFERWVFEEVLPSIRKTGSYSTKQAPRQDAQPRVMRNIGAEFKGALLIAKLAGLSGNQAILSANAGIRKMYGHDPLAMIESTHLVAPVQERHYTPTDLGRAHFDESAIAFNKRLAAAGLQVRDESDEWLPTKDGRPHAIILDTGKRHGDGTPVQQLRWLSSVVDVLKTKALLQSVIPPTQGE